MSNFDATRNEMTDRNAWVWGFSPQAEIWNGRFAMIGFVAAILVEVMSNKGVLHFWGLMSSNTIPTV